MRVWLDDERPMPADYDVWVKDSSYMKAIIDTGIVTKIAFDHDMGEGKPTGYDIALYIEELCVKGKLANWIKCTVHTANPVGRTNICRALQKAYEIWKGES